MTDHTVASGTTTGATNDKANTGDWSNSRYRRLEPQEQRDNRYWRHERQSQNWRLICRLWLQYLLSCPVAPVHNLLAFERLWLSSICISSRSWLQSPVSVVRGTSIVCRLAPPVSSISRCSWL